MRAMGSVGAQSRGAGAPGSGAMFDRIAGRYDLLNRILSLGMDGWWRRRLVRALGVGPGDRVLDVAVGTGDVMAALLRLPSRPLAVGVDPALAMVARGAAKLRGRPGRWGLIGGDGMCLPFRGGAFAAATVAFGIRNFPDRLGALREMARVTRRGGRVAVLELQVPDHGPLAPFARLWVRHVVPAVGGLLSGRAEYRYLRESMHAFPPPGEFLALMAGAGLVAASSRAMSGGAVRLYVGTVPS